MLTGRWSEYGKMFRVRQDGFGGKGFSRGFFGLKQGKESAATGTTINFPSINSLQRQLKQLQLWPEACTCPGTQCQLLLIAATSPTLSPSRKRRESRSKASKRTGKFFREMTAVGKLARVSSSRLCKAPGAWKGETTFEIEFE